MTEQVEESGKRNLHTASEKDLLRVCCVCKKICLSSEWIDSSNPLYEYLKSIYRGDVTHGYCPECLDRRFSEISE